MRKKLLMQAVGLFVLVTAVLAGCRKDITTPEPSVKAITFADAKKWVEDNPIAQTVGLDWSKSRRINDDGTTVINVPVTREDRLSLIRNSTHKAVLAPMTLGSVEARGNTPDNSSETNPNFTPGHPPALLFVKDSSEQVKGYMYNFVAANKEKENGSDGVWTGKLYQWNLKSDTLLVMEFEKSKIIKRSLMTSTKTASSGTSFAKIATMRPENQVASLWTWLGNILSDIWDALNWIGWHLMIPGAHNNAAQNNNHIRTWDLDWGAQSTMQYTVATIDSGPYNSYLISGGSGYGIPAMSATDHLLLRLYINNTAVANYLENNGTVVSEMTNYLNVHGASLENIQFLVQVAEYLTANPTEDFNFIRDQYFGVNYQPDGSYNSDNYEPVTVASSPAALPTWSAFATAFPKVTITGVAHPQEMSATNVYALVGGNMNTQHLAANPLYQNACAIRGSRGLNYAGKTIPVITYDGKQQTEQGSDGQNYILAAKSFNRYMNETFGAPTARLSGSAANDFATVLTFLRGKTGIFTVVNLDGSPAAAGYSGHVTMIRNGETVGRAFTRPKGGVLKIEIWELQ